MLPVSDEFLLNMAEVSASLIGLFLVGVFFYVETGFRRFERGRDAVEPYMRAGTRIVLVLFAIPLGLSLTLVVLEPVWSRVIFLVLSIFLILANIDTAARILSVRKYTRSNALFINEVAGTVGVVVLVVLPWVLGGLRPTREDLTWAILLAFTSGFISISALVLSAFDIARIEAGDRTEDET
jgi:hypothetical protein